MVASAIAAVTAEARWLRPRRAHHRRLGGCRPAGMLPQKAPPGWPARWPPVPDSR